MSDRPTENHVSPELAAAVTPLLHAASEFAIAATRMFAEINQNAAAAMALDANAGLAGTVIEIELTPNATVSLCMDVGTERRRIVTVPTVARTVN